MRHTHALATIAIVAGGLAAICYPKAARSADHFDPPAAGAMGVPPTLDIADVYSWMSDANTIVFAMTVYPIAPTTAKFDTNVQYTFHTFSYAATGPTTIGDPDNDITITFDAAQKLSLWIGNPATSYVSGDASSATAPLASTDGKIKVFAGLRADPFFANFAGFLTAVQSVKTAAAAMPPVLTFNDAGCPTNAPAAVAGQLSHSADGGAPANFFATYNSLAIVVAVDKSLIALKGPLVSVHAATYLTGGGSTPDAGSITDAGGQ